MVLAVIVSLLGRNRPSRLQQSCNHWDVLCQLLYEQQHLSRSSTWHSHLLPALVGSNRQAPWPTVNGTHRYSSAPFLQRDRPRNASKTQKMSSSWVAPELERARTMEELVHVLNQVGSTPFTPSDIVTVLQTTQRLSRHHPDHPSIVRDMCGQLMHHLPLLSGELAVDALTTLFQNGPKLTSNLAAALIRHLSANDFKRLLDTSPNRPSAQDLAHALVKLGCEGRLNDCGLLKKSHEWWLEGVESDLAKGGVQPTGACARTRTQAVLQMMWSLRQAPQNWIDDVDRRRLVLRMLPHIMCTLPEWEPQQGGLLVYNLGKLGADEDAPALVDALVFLARRKEDCSTMSLSVTMWALGNLAKRNVHFAASFCHPAISLLVADAIARQGALAAQPGSTGQGAAPLWVWPPPAVFYHGAVTGHAVQIQRERMQMARQRADVRLSATQEDRQSRSPVNFNINVYSLNQPQLPCITWVAPVPAGQTLHWQDTPLSPNAVRRGVMPLPSFLTGRTARDGPEAVVSPPTGASGASDPLLRVTWQGNVAAEQAVQGRLLDEGDGQFGSSSTPVQEMWSALTKGSQAGETAAKAAMKNNPSFTPAYPLVAIALELAETLSQKLCMYAQRVERGGRDSTVDYTENWLDGLGALSQAGQMLFGLNKMRIVSTKVADDLNACLSTLASAPRTNTSISASWAMSSIAAGLASMYTRGVSGPLVAQMADGLLQTENAITIRASSTMMYAMATSDQPGSPRWRAYTTKILQREHACGWKNIAPVAAGQMAQYITVLRELEWEAARVRGDPLAGPTVWDWPPSQPDQLIPWGEPWLKEAMPELYNIRDNETQAPNVSYFQRGLSLTLSRIVEMSGDAWQPLQIEEHTEDEVSSMDCLLTSKCGRVRVAVEADGPWHFMLNDTAVFTGETARRVRLLARRGYLQMLVPYHQWEPLHRGDGQVKYVQDLLRTMLTAVLPHEPDLVDRLVGPSWSSAEAQDRMQDCRKKQLEGLQMNTLLDERRNVVRVLHEAAEVMRTLPMKDESLVAGVAGLHTPTEMATALQSLATAMTSETNNATVIVRQAERVKLLLQSVPGLPTLAGSDLTPQQLFEFNISHDLALRSRMLVRAGVQLRSALLPMSGLTFDIGQSSLTSGGAGVWQTRAQEVQSSASSAISHMQLAEQELSKYQEQRGIVYRAWFHHNFANSHPGVSAKTGRKLDHKNDRDSADHQQRPTQKWTGQHQPWNNRPVDEHPDDPRPVGKRPTYSGSSNRQQQHQEQQRPWEHLPPTQSHSTREPRVHQGYTAADLLQGVISKRTGKALVPLPAGKASVMSGPSAAALQVQPSTAAARPPMHTTMGAYLQAQKGEVQPATALPLSHKAQPTATKSAPRKAKDQPAALLPLKTVSLEGHRHPSELGGLTKDPIQPQASADWKSLWRRKNVRK